MNRPPLVPELLKLPQVTFDVLFDPDSSIIRPGSYRTLGRIADTLTDPALLPYRFLIVGHTESGGRRDHNLIVSQRAYEAKRAAKAGMSLDKWLASKRSARPRSARV